MTDYLWDRNASLLADPKYAKLINVLSSQSMRCQDNHPGSLSTSFAFTELLSATITSLPPQPRLQELYSFTHQSRSCQVTRAQRCRAVRESTKHQETHDKTVRTVTWCMAKYPNPQCRCENLSLKPPICEFWETNRFYL